MAFFLPHRAGYRRFPFSATFFLCLAIAALLASVMIPHLWQQYKVSRWPAVPARIVSSRLEVKPSRERQLFDPVITYSYTISGKSYSSDRFSVTGSAATSDAAAAQQRLKEFPVGSIHTCYVNPADPGMAVLDNHVSWWMLIMFVGPLVIWVISDWRRISEWRESRSAPPNLDGLEPLAANAALRKTVRSNLLIAVFCLLMATGMSWWSWMGPLWNAHVRTLNWKPVPCIVTHISISKQDNYHGPSYSPEVRFSYEYEGRQFVGSRLDFSGDTGTDIAEAERRLRGIHPGESTCLVDPADPSQAVLRRSVFIDRFFGPFMMFFFVGSLGMLVGAVWGGRKKQAKMPAGAAAPVATLKHVPPALLLVGCVIGGAACVAGAAWVGWLCWENFRRGLLEFLQGIYVFVLGSGAVFCFKNAWKCWLGCICPPPRLKLMPGAVTLGESFEVAWVFPDAGKRRHQVRFWLEGREETRVLEWVSNGHGQMKQEKQKRAVFAHVPIAGQDGTESGSQRITMPGNTMHSLQGKKTAIRWVLRAQRRGERGEPIEYDFPVEVLPHNKVPHLSERLP